MGLKHSSSDVARAFLEGVCFELRRCVEVIDEHDVVDCAMVSGNITRSESSMQLLADILNARLARCCRSRRRPMAPRFWRSVRISGEPAPPAARATVFCHPSALSARYDTLYDDYRKVAERCAQSFP